MKSPDTGERGFSIIIILIIGAIGERILALRRLLEAKEVVLFSKGRLDQDAMKKYMIEAPVAPEYGLAHYQEFEQMILEGDDSISGIFRSNKPGPGQKIKPIPASECCNCAVGQVSIRLMIRMPTD